MSLGENHSLYTIREVDESKIAKNVKDRMAVHVSKVTMKVVQTEERCENYSDISVGEKGVKCQVTDQAHDNQLSIDSQSAAASGTNVNKDGTASSQREEGNDQRQLNDEVQVKHLPKIKTVPSKPVTTFTTEEVWKRQYPRFTVTKACLLVLAGLSYTMSIPTLLIGSIYYSDCPVSWLVPFYLIIAGCLGLALSSFMTADILVVYPSRMTGFTSGLFWASVVCHSVGLIATIRLRHIQFDDKNALNYCNELLFHFALYTSSSLILAFIVIISVLIFVWICRSTH